MRDETTCILADRFREVSARAPKRAREPRALPRISPYRVSRHNRKYPRRKTGAAFRFRKTDHDYCAGFGHLIKIREQLDLVMIRAQDVSLQQVIVFTRGDPWIGVGGFVT
jgi:hypothetical protein